MVEQANTDFAGILKWGFDRSGNNFTFSMVALLAPLIQYTILCRICGSTPCVTVLCGDFVLDVAEAVQSVKN